MSFLRFGSGALSDSLCDQEFDKSVRRRRCPREQHMELSLRNLLPYHKRKARLVVNIAGANDFFGFFEKGTCRRRFIRSLAIIRGDARLASAT
jgi:hypothetical protein